MNADIDRLEPIFDFNTKQSSFLLYEYPVEICVEGESFVGVAEVRMDLFPQAKILIYGYFEDIPTHIALSLSLDNMAITFFCINGHNIEGLLLSSNWDSAKKKYMIKWCPKSEPVVGAGDESTQMVRLIFHLFNFVDFFGSRFSVEKYGAKKCRISHMDLINDKWKVELKSLFSSSMNVKLLKEKGGYQLTHVGEIRKANGSQFSGKNAHEFLNLLRYFVSFARGAWCEPLCVVGFDAKGNRVWELWSSPREPWHTVQSWFDPHNGSQLVSLFPGFMKLWTNNNWNEALREGIYWYLNANNSSRGIDAGIILTQAAIERLSYEYIVKEKHLLKTKEFKDLRASDKMRLLLSSLEIPCDIPSLTSKLHDLASSSEFKWLDSPHALTEFRNYLIHPEKKNKEKFRSAYFEAWNLGLWYLEMALLSICGYQDTYGNRLKQRWAGMVENVPWKE